MAATLLGLALLVAHQLQLAQAEQAELQALHMARQLELILLLVLVVLAVVVVAKAPMMVVVEMVVEMVVV
jgi:hypothetical protein